MKQRSKIWIVLAFAALAAACGGEAVPCDTVADCEAREEARGQICVASACRPCASDAECARDDRYGAGATCAADGRCVAACMPGSDGCPCGAGESCDSGLACVDGLCHPSTGCDGCPCGPGGECTSGLVCEDGVCAPGGCELGTRGCGCLANDTCEPGLTCDAVAEVCVDCQPGRRMCECGPGNTCDAGLRCDLATNTCPPADCGDGSEGTVGCMCRATDPACDDGAVCRGGLCASCNNAMEGCPCEDGACVGLVCGDGTCRRSLTCSEAGCVPNQRCEPSTSTRDAECLRECEPGFVWDATAGTCLEVRGTTCTEGAPSDITPMCRDRNRVCMETATGARCGACLSGRVEDEGECRAPLTCADLSCSTLQRACVTGSPGVDATCGACLPGYVSGSGGCVPDATANCTEGAAGSILATCRAQNRECGLVGGTTTCTSCVGGYVEDPASGACVERRTCAELACAAQNRDCVEGPPAQCTTCSCGFVDDGAGGCRARRTCAESACAPTQSCRDDGCGDAMCDGPICTPTQTWDMYSASCVECPVSCTDGTPSEGETGNVAPGTVFVGAGVPGVCICETQPGYFYSREAGSGTFPCDADGDGWVRQTARSSIESTDAVLRAQARCTVHRVSSVNLEGDAPERRTHSETLPTPLVLYESLRNDDPAQLDLAPATEVPSYGTRRLRARELNSMTKACVGPAADHNHNFVADVAEYAGIAFPTGGGVSEVPTALRSSYEQYTRFSYFVELHEGAFVPDDPTAYGSRPATGPHYVDGVYRIAERPRALAASLGGVPVNYGRAASDPSVNHYRECRRHRDADYGTVTTMATGFDLAAHVADGEAVMTHHSQYRCLQVVDDTTWSAADLSRNRHLARLRDLQLPSQYAVNLCSVTGEPVPGDGPLNPDSPLLVCSVSDTLPPLSINQVVWGAVEYVHGVTPRAGETLLPSISCTSSADCFDGMTCVAGTCQGRSEITCDPMRSCPSGLRCVEGYCRASGYVRGCVDECTEHGLLPPAEQCSGIGTPGVACEADRANFGQVQCGCGRNYGGASCEVGCPTPELMLDPSYAISPRSGYWMCGHFAASDGRVLSNGTYTLRGEVPLTATDGVPLVGGPYTLRSR